MKINPIIIAIISFLAGVLVTLSYGVSTPNNMFAMTGDRQDFNMMGNIDRHFIQQMIPHHQGAIEMAQLAREKSKREQVKLLAEDIIKSQSAEIDQMRNWYKSWFESEVYESVGSMGMMQGRMMRDQSDVQELRNASDFDEAFLKEMIPHHQMALMMANMLLAGTDRPELKTLGQNIISAQSKEIEAMRQWQKDWGYDQ